MKKLLAMCSIVLMSQSSFGWGAPEIMKADLRVKKYELSHKLDKKKSFQKIIIWSAKSFNNSNEAVKLKDPEMGLFIAKGNIPCDALKLGSGYGKDQRIDLTLEISTEDNKTEIKFTEIVGMSSGSYDDGSRPSKKEELDAVVTACLDPYVEKIKSELN